MDESEFTVEQAADPSTPAQTLADIAALRPDLRPTVARNPAAYPGLLEWLGSLGEPGVDAALAERRAADAAAAAEATQLPTVPGGPGVPPAPSWAGPDTAAVPGAPAAPYGHPAGWQGQPPPQQWQGQTPPPGAPYGGPYGAPYGSPMGAPPKKRSLTWLWILLGVIGLLVIGGIVLAGVLVSRVADAIPDVGVDTGAGYGDDAALDALWDACAAEDWQACDDLYSRSPLGSEYEAFGNTCGNRTDGGTYCVDEFATGSQDSGTGTGSETDGGTYGSDPALDALYDACGAGDDAACDSLWEQAPVGSEYETFGDTCGGRQEAETQLWCEAGRN